MASSHDRFGMALLLLLAATACTKAAPTGQVIATVNGEEIPHSSLQSLAASLGIRGDAEGTAPVRRALVQRLVDETLLAQAAKARKLDQSPTFLADVERVKRQMLAGAALQSLRPDAAPQPAEGDVDRYIAAHPAAFADHVLLTIDRIRFPAGAGKPPSWLDTVEDMDLAEATLKRTSVQYVRGTDSADLTDLPPPAAAKLAAQPVGRLFYYREGENVVVARILDRTKVAVPRPMQRSMARRLIAQADGDRVTARAVAELRAKAQIVYQPRYAPPPPAKAKTG